MLDFGFKITRENANTPVNAKLIFIIWLMSSISIINQFIAIHELGGIVNYISNLASRVQYFKGKGYILVLNGLIATVNVFYFAYLLSNKRINIPHWILFFIHFIIFVVMALLSGSRSFLLITILVQIICFHYIRKELTIVKLLPFVLTIVFLIALIGGIRNSFNSNGESLSFKDENVQLNSTHFKYGLIPFRYYFF
ncbi:Uncharacterised protein [Providencia rustigianii]|nr:Uncharacterised protein [Providencia rustigianii]